jgi:putative membrane protein
MWGPDWGMMHGWGGYGWMGPLHTISWIVVVLVAIALVVWFLRSGAQRSPSSVRSEQRSPGLDVLEERYARGEINRDEYLQKKRDITG